MAKAKCVACGGSMHNPTWGCTRPARCACGVPNQANTHYFVVIGTPDETDYLDIYVCSDHDPGTEDDDDVRTLFAFDGSDSWDVLETTRTEIR